MAAKGLTLVALVFSALFFIIGPVFGAVALALTAAIALTARVGRTRLAASLYMFFFGILAFLLSPLVGIVVLVLGLTIAVRMAFVP